MLKEQMAIIASKVNAAPQASPPPTSANSTPAVAAPVAKRKRGRPTKAEVAARAAAEVKALANG